MAAAEYGVGGIRLDQGVDQGQGVEVGRAHPVGQHETTGQAELPPHVLALRVGAAGFVGRAGGQRGHHADLARVDAEAPCELLLGCAVERDDAVRPAAREAAQAEQDEAFEERVAVRMAQEIEIGHRHHAEDAVQVRRQGQGQAAAVVEVRVGAAARVGHAPVLRRVFGEQFGQTPGIGRRRGCGGGVESDFHGKKSS